MVQRSPIARLFRRIFSWRGLRCSLIVLAWTTTIIGLVYGEENWRGRRAWNKLRHEKEALGEKIDPKLFIPPPVPEEQNFAATPEIKSWFPSHRDWTDDYSRVSGKIGGRLKSGRVSRRFIDLVSWGAAFTAAQSGATNNTQQFKTEERDLQSRAKAAPAVLEGLKSSDATLDELRTASQRPYTRYPVVYDLDNPWGVLLPHLAKIKGACQRLELKACAELADGQSEKALEDVKLMLYLSDSLKEEWFLISYLTRIACVQITLQPIWEGLAEHRWSDPQLQELQARLQKDEFLENMRHSMAGERAAGILTVDLLYRQKYRLTDLMDPPDAAVGGFEFINLLGRIAPHGWYYQEQRNYCRLFDLQVGGTFDLEKKRIFPARFEQNSHEFERVLSGGRLGRTLHTLVRHQLVAAMMLPSLSKVQLRTAAAQATVNQAMEACALERFRLANGKFPQEPTALVPRFLSQLPNDLITGEPYKYVSRDDGQFTLYSIGWNEKDDGGIPGATLTDEAHGDWVWEYPR
jgi:hypothetical protein